MITSGPGDLIRARRLDLGLLQRQVAEEVGVDETTVYNWENNRVNPAVRLIPQIIQSLGYCPYTPRLPVGGRLKPWRQSPGHSQEKMAQVVDADVGMLRRWEKGRKSPSGKY
ncbi:MAG: helix-turn-helix domain-containing protein [Pyrinomonadaceae bacterium]